MNTALLSATGTFLERRPGPEPVCLGPAGSAWVSDSVWERCPHRSPGHWAGVFTKAGTGRQEGPSTEAATAGLRSEPRGAALAPWDVREKGGFGDSFRGSAQDNLSLPILPQFQGSWGPPELRRCMGEEGGERGGRRCRGMLQGGGERPICGSFIAKAFKGGGLWGGAR